MKIKSLPSFVASILFLIISCSDLESDSDSNQTFPTSRSECTRISSNLSHETIPSRLKTPKMISEALIEITGNVDKNIDIVPDFKTYRRDKYGLEIVNFRYSYNKKNLCQISTTVYKYGNKLTLQGKIPPIELLNLEEKIFWEKPELIQTLKENFKTPSEIKLVHVDDCLAVENNHLIAAWDIEVEVNKEPYRVIMNNNQIFQINPKFFHLKETTALIYTTDSSPSNEYKILAETPVTVTNEGELCNERFKVIVSDENMVATWNEEEQFYFDPETEIYQLEQVSMFVNANIQTDYMLSLPSVEKWYGPQINLTLKPSMNELNNNAQYIPGSSFNKAAISLGRGNNETLRNLREDPEAISHEVGHHIIYNWLKNASGESLILHEGISDSFVMFRTKNSCICEMICPKIQTCVSLGCLRQANNDYTLNDPRLGTAAHTQSQLISGLMWSLAMEIDDINNFDIAANILYKAVSLFSEDAGFTEFIANLVTADKILYQGNYCSIIKELVEERNFEQTVSCS